MSVQDMTIQLDEEDAFHYIVRYLREGRSGPYSSYGYGCYLPNVMREYLASVAGAHPSDTDRYLSRVSPPFYNAAWELCRRGILRPGITTHGRQATDDGGSGNGYSLTAYGEKWLQQAGSYDYVPVEPGRFARLLDNLGGQLGLGFRERSQEAVRCYNAQAYLACCAMCGAAAESILLALAIAKSGDEAKILKDYSSAGGRGRIENLLIGLQNTAIQNEFRASSSLLKYWRDAAAHGKKSNITDNEAYTSLALLLRFAQFANDRWGDLTGTP